MVQSEQRDGTLEAMGADLHTFDDTNMMPVTPSASSFLDAFGDSGLDLLMSASQISIPNIAAGGSMPNIATGGSMPNNATSNSSIPGVAGMHGTRRDPGDGFRWSWDEIKLVLRRPFSSFSNTSKGKSTLRSNPSASKSSGGSFFRNSLQDVKQRVFSSDKKGKGKGKKAKGSKKKGKKRNRPVSTDEFCPVPILPPTAGSVDFGSAEMVAATAAGTAAMLRNPRNESFNVDAMLANAYAGGDQLSRNPAAPPAPHRNANTSGATFVGRKAGGLTSRKPKVKRERTGEAARVPASAVSVADMVGNGSPKQSKTQRERQRRDKVTHLFESLGSVVGIKPQNSQDAVKDPETSREAILTTAVDEILARRGMQPRYGGNVRKAGKRRAGSRSKKVRTSTKVVKKASVGNPLFSEDDLDMI